MNSITTLYDNRFSQKERERKLKIWQVIVNKFIQKFIPENATLIDAACGYGEMINNVRCKKKIAIDINPDAAQYLAHDIEFAQGNSVDILKKYENTVDVIFTSNFLEHLADKKVLEDFLVSVHRSLRKNGKYIVLGPNLRYLPGQYWDFYDHSLGLTHLSLIEVLQLHNFEIEYCLDKFLPYTTKSKLPTHPFFVSAYLWCPPAWRIMGKQFFIVARKRD